ncbi:NRAMP family divalent metal transporter [Clostridium sp. BJN0013]|uniref:NRAMP family divalent metal transporter n=1 Tax=Clostridium sp. BJN0013 TaxID=3236840 RepID=UPI0034C689A1
MNGLNENRLEGFNIGKSKFYNSIDKKEKKYLDHSTLLWTVIGPGLLAAMGDNDAGGVISYCVTGIKFGISLFIPLCICLIIIPYAVQEMSMRVGTISQSSLIKLIEKHYGKYWVRYHVAALFVENILMLSTEFIGMTAGLIVIGIPIWMCTAISLVLILSIVTFAGYKKKERMALLIGSSNIIFIVIAFIVHPNVVTSPYNFMPLNLVHGSNDLLWYIAAIAGNSIAPWMVFFQSSAYVDKGGAGKSDIFERRVDIRIGCIVQVIIAICILISGAALFGHIQNIENAGPAELIIGFTDYCGRGIGTLFALGIFNAGLLASITISLSSSWCVADAFNWPCSLNDKIREAPKFYIIYIGSVIIAAMIILIPNLPLNYIALITQIIGGIIMIPIIIFIILMANKKDIMGKYKNTLFINIRAYMVAAILIGITILLLWNFL